MALSAAARTVSGPLATSGHELASIIGGTLIVDGTKPIRGCAVDSRLASAGQMFLALPGERTHGLHHASEALRAGATAIVLEGGEATAELRQILAEVELAVRATGASLISVEEGRVALSRAATEWRNRFTLEVIGVTGSVGKTTTKQLIAAALGGESAGCAATPGNANNEIGLPMSLLNLPDGTVRYVAEMGMYVEGDIRALCTLARPRIGVVTAIDAVHAERAGDLDAIERGKGELVEALPPEGWAVLAADAHNAVGHAAATSGLELLIVFGAEADGIAEGARAGGMPIEKIMRLSSDEAGIAAAVGLLGDMAASGDTILVKASRSVELERLIGGLATRWSEEAK